MTSSLDGIWWESSKQFENAIQPKITFILPLQDTTGIPIHFWGVFDGHAGSGAALAASKLLHRSIRDRLCDVAHILENQNSPPPICLAKNGSPFQAEAKKGACLDGEEQDGPLDEPRFHMEKDISVESLVMGIIETAFRQMVRTLL